jgi:hypothetical protein
MTHSRASADLLALNVHFPYVTIQERGEKSAGRLPVRLARHFLAYTPQKWRASDPVRSEKMGAGPTTDWGKEAVERIAQLTLQVADLGKKMDQVVEFQEKTKPYLTRLDTVKSLLFLVISIGGTLGIVAVTASIWRFAELSSAATHHEKQIYRLQDDVKELAKSNLKIASIIENQPFERIYAGRFRFQEVTGRIKRVSKESITLERRELRFPMPKKAKEKEKEGAIIEYTCSIAPGARVIIDNRTASLQDLKIGMQVRLLVADGERVELIEVEPEI